MTVDWNPLYTDPLCWVLAAWLLCFPVGIMVMFANNHRR